MSDSLQPHGLQPARFCQWDPPGKNTGMSFHALLPGDLPKAGVEPISPVAPALQANPLLLSP